MKIAIAGAGITGLSLGLALQKTGFQEFEIFERAAELNEVGAGIMLQPNAMKVLDWLGLGDRCREAGKVIGMADITDARLKSISKTDEQAITDTSGQKIIAIHRARLQEILFDALPAGKIHLAHTLEDFSSHENELTLFFKDRSSVTTDLLLGADGIHSMVRTKLFPHSTLRYSGQTCWRGLADYNLPDLIRGSAKEAWGYGLRFGFVSISPGQVYWFAVEKAAPGGKDEKSGLKDRLLKTFRKFHPLVLGMIDQTKVESILRNDIFDLRRLDSWSQDRIGLFGDAGHATTPNMGQGACQGIEDAYYFSRLLSGKENPKEVFRIFEEKRRRKVDFIVNNSWQLGRLAHHPVGSPFVKLIMRLTPKKLIERQMHQLFAVEGL